MKNKSSSILDQLKNGIKNIHFIGIGGSGMFPLAQILQKKGYKISGSDVTESYVIDLERKLGMDIVMTQKAENIKGADLIVYSAAIMEDNPELIAAKRSNSLLLERAELLGALVGLKSKCVGVTGTHGKTTTTALITHILIESDKDPSAIIGGKLKSINGNAILGDSNVMICEACEYADTFLKVFPTICVILNVDEDHMEYFKTLNNVIQSYKNFCDNTSDTVIINGDDDNGMKVIQNSNKHIIKFGINKNNDFYLDNINFKGYENNKFDIFSAGKKISSMILNIPGEHNAINALAAFIVCLELGCTIEEIEAGVKSFGGIGRRFEILGEYNGAVIADDYAHHPVELKATLKAASTMGFNRIWAIFQPFTFSRTFMLLDDFKEALSIADKVILSPIMGSREVNTHNIYSEDLAKKIPGSIVINTFDEIASFIRKNVKTGDLVITLGCGDIYKCANKIIK